MEKFVYGIFVLIALLIVKSTSRVGYLYFLGGAVLSNLITLFYGEVMIFDLINFSYISNASLFAVLFATIMRESHEYRNKVDNIN